MPRPIRAAVSAAAFAHNLALAGKYAGRAKLWAVLKANAYGHGLERAARALAAADGYAVLDFEEAARLRALGVQKPILMLEGCFEPGDVALVARHGLTPVIHHAVQLEVLSRSPLERAIDVYLKANSGMNRLGFNREGLHSAFKTLRALPQVRRITLMTHFADADGAGGVGAQLAAFEAMAQPLGPLPRSLANSAALLRFPGETAADWARPGIMLYGCSPFGETSPSRSAAALGLKPVMSLTSQIIATQELRAGDRVGYGSSYEATRAQRIGVVACGYADGYPRHAPGGTPVLVNGRRTSTVGRVSMDMITVDLGPVPDAGIGAPVTLWGEGLSADEVGAAAGTLSYELLTKVSARVPIFEGP